MFDYIKYTVAICFISWIVGLVLNGLLMRSSMYTQLSNFNLLPSSKWNSRLGMHYFRRLVKNTPFKFFNQKLKMKGSSIDLVALRREMTAAEIGHLIAFVFVLFFAVYWSFVEGLLFGLIILFF